MNSLFFIAGLAGRAREDCQRTHAECGFRLAISSARARNKINVRRSRESDSCKAKLNSGFRAKRLKFVLQPYGLMGCLLAFNKKRCSLSPSSIEGMHYCVGQWKNVVRNRCSSGLLHETRLNEKWLLRKSSWRVINCFRFKQSPVVDSLKTEIAPKEEQRNGWGEGESRYSFPHRHNIREFAVFEALDLGHLMGW